MTVRLFVPSDAPRLIEIVRANRIFDATELEWAAAVVRRAAEAGDASEYSIFISAADDQITGWSCIGPTPHSRGVWDLYWIAVDPLFQGTGIGTFLLRFAEKEARARGGEVLLIETSARPNFQPTVQFYLKHGYAEVSRLKDFRRVVADRLLFARRLEP